MKVPLEVLRRYVWVGMSKIDAFEANNTDLFFQCQLEMFDLKNNAIESATAALKKEKAAIEKNIKAIEEEIHRQFEGAENLDLSYQPNVMV